MQTCSDVSAPMASVGWLQTLSLAIVATIETFSRHVRWCWMEVGT